MGLYLKQLQVGPMQNYVYLIGDTETRKAVAVDPAWAVDAIVDVLEKDDMTLESVLITHFHPDHIGGSLMGHDIEGPAELLERGHKIKIYIHKSEADYVPQVCGLSKTDLTLTEAGDDLVVGEQRIQFIHTPGHTPGSSAFWSREISSPEIRYSSAVVDESIFPAATRRRCTTVSTTSSKPSPTTPFCTQATTILRPQSRPSATRKRPIRTCASPGSRTFSASWGR